MSYRFENQFQHSVTATFFFARFSVKAVLVTVLWKFDKIVLVIFVTALWKFNEI